MTNRLNAIMKGFSGLAAAALLAFGLAGPANALTSDEIKEKGTLVVGVLTDFPPYGGTDANQQPAGYDVDVAVLMAEDLGVELEIVPVTGPNRLPYLLTNRVDMLVATLGITAERSEQILFSKPYSTLRVLVMAPKDLDISGPDDLAKFTVGVTRAGSQDTFVSAVAPDGTRIMRFDDDAVSLQAIVAGQVEVLGGSNIHLARLINDHPELGIEEKFPLNSQGNGVGIRKGDEELQEWSNGFIDRIVESGQLDEIHQRWLGTPLPELPPMPDF